MNYSERIKTLREERGLTQARLADILSCPRPLIARWESGLAVPSVFYAKKMAEFFGATVDELMWDEGTMSPSTALGIAAARRGEGRSDVFPTIVVAILSFIPIFLYYVFKMLTEAARMHLVLEGIERAVDYRKVTDLLERANAAICLGILLFIALFWIARLFVKFKATNDKFARHEVLKNWNIGTMFILVNAVVVAFVEFSYVRLNVLLIYVGALSVATLADSFIMALIGFFGKEYILFANNPVLKKLDFVFFILRTFFLSVMLIYTVCIFQISPSSAPYGFLVALLFFTAVCFGTEIVYLSLRLTIKNR